VLVSRFLVRERLSASGAYLTQNVGSGTVHYFGYNWRAASSAGANEFAKTAIFWVIRFVSPSLLW
jgi:hypothetical protein